MEDRGLESAVEQLRSSVLSLQQRVAALEARGLEGPAAVLDAAPAAATQGESEVRKTRARSKDPYDPIAILSLVGRLLLVLAGGFFLRALTDAGVLADPVGIALAFAYAATWLVMSDRAGARAQVPSAVCHALAAAMVAFPLAVEATVRFKVLSGLASVVVLSVLSAALLFVAWRRALRAVAWITVIAALPTSAALLIQTGIVAPFALFLIALGVATLWLAYATDWWGSRWLAALAADVAVAGVTLRAFAPEHRDAPQVAVVLQFLLLFGYLASIAWRTLARGREVSRFEIVQTAAALLVSLGGAVFMAQATGAVPAIVGGLALAVGAACYGLAVAVVQPRSAGALNFHFYTTLAFALVLAGFTIALEGLWLGVAFSLLAVLAIGLWSRGGRLYLLLHGAGYVIAAAVVSDALGYSARALVAGMQGPWATPGAAMLVALVAGVLSAALAARRTIAQGTELAIGTRFVIVLVLVWTACGSVIGFIAPAAAMQNGRSVDPGVLATVSTGVLSIATLAIAWIARQDRFREWGWLVYPLLVGIGLKLMAQDFKHSRPATLFIAMALYGAALIIAPRLRRRADKPAV